MVHTSQKELNQKLIDARKQIEIGAIYSHYKSPEKKYVVEFIGMLESSEEVCVGYRALYGGAILWIRTVENFIETVDTGNGKVARFIQCLEENGD